HYLLTRFSRAVASYAIAGEHLVVLTVPPAGEDGPTQLISFELGTALFDQSPQLLVNLDDSVGLLPPGSGGIRLHSSSAGKTGLSVYFEDPTSSTDWSWVSFFIDIEANPAGSYIEMTSSTLTEEIEVTSDERNPTSTYLAEVFDLQATMVSIRSISVQSEVSAKVLADVWAESSDRVTALDPPGNNVELNNRWASNLDGFREETELFAASVESQDDDTVQRETRRFLLALVSLAKASAAISTEQFALAADSLSTRLDPEAVYVAGALSAQEPAGEARSVLQTFLANLATNAESTMAGVPITIDLLMAQQLELDQLEVPTSAQPLHQARLDHLDSIMSILEKLLNDFEAGVSPSGILQLRMDRLVAQSADLYSAWSRYIAEVLR
ncbi:MAG: hypothetical protein GXP35_15500, partial [Actinobacteria bacterium]|nr:hypothetical protein [Actinomycetota bacterium]